MGAQESSFSGSRFCVGDTDMSCGFGRQESPGKIKAFMTDEGIQEALSVVSRWIEAREAGDIEAAAACCHNDFAFMSAQLTLHGLQPAKDRLFIQRAPMPAEIMRPLSMKEESTKEKPVFYREVKFSLGAEGKKQEIRTRQEWTVVPAADDSPPLIIGMVAGRAHSREMYS